MARNGCAGRGWGRGGDGMLRGWDWQAGDTRDGLVVRWRCSRRRGWTDRRQAPPRGVAPGGPTGPGVAWARSWFGSAGMAQDRQKVAPAPVKGRSAGGWTEAGRRRSSRMAPDLAPTPSPARVPSQPRRPAGGRSRRDKEAAVRPGSIRLQQGGSVSKSRRAEQRECIWWAERRHACGSGGGGGGDGAQRVAQLPRQRSAGGTGLDRIDPSRAGRAPPPYERYRSLWPAGSLLPAGRCL